MYTLHFSLLHASFLYKLLCLNFDIVLDCWKIWHLRYANQPFHVSVIHILKFHCLESSASIFGKCLGRKLHSTKNIISQLHLYANGHGVVVLVGLMVAISLPQESLSLLSSVWTKWQYLLGMPLIDPSLQNHLETFTKEDSCSTKM